ncbi:thioredoxin domain-containing protein [Kribbella jejuensis]|uniref:Protein-disulfide isomerase n=1 Tax=Kribbella jejuensis TaxID=236068 RepID=A0A542D9R6_9ACTN|nr:thioredoxin domain-containing protein [Kribbella jejuensis]TQI99818.1 protein-disulfide isomerase [Kribbella jejuensis]
MSSTSTLQQKRRVAPGIVVVIVLVLALGAGVGVQYYRGHSKVEVASTGRTEPAVITGPGTSGKGVTVGKAGAKVNIDLYLDFRCPHCAEFEKDSGATIDKLVEDGTATLTYWPLQFVNPDSSPRLANAFAAAAANGKALSFVDELYGDFSKSWTSDQLIELGKQLGVGDAKYQQALQDNTYAGWLESVNKAADDRGVTGTPTVYVDGKQLPTDQLTPEGLQKAAAEAAS